MIRPYRHAGPLKSSLNFGVSSVERVDVFRAILFSGNSLKQKSSAYYIPGIRQWAEDAPGRIFLAERKTDREWRKFSYGQTAAVVNAVSQAFAVSQALLGWTALQKYFFCDKESEFMIKNTVIGAMLVFLMQACQTYHEVEVAPVEVKPIHIIIDVNVKVDRALDDFFGDIDKAAETSR